VGWSRSLACSMALPSVMEGSWGAGTCTARVHLTPLAAAGVQSWWRKILPSLNRKATKWELHAWARRVTSLALYTTFCLLATMQP
jgi:hypothetical protein